MKKNAGKKTEAIPLQFEVCGDEIKKQIHKLVATRHPDLANCNIVGVWRNKEMKNKGSVVGAKIQKINDCMRALADHHFIIVIASPTWKEMSDVQRMAVLDHELCHIHYDEDDGGNPTYSLINHDVEDFAQIIQLYGLYHTGLVEFGNAVKGALEKLPKDVVVKKLGEPDEDPVEVATKKASSGKKKSLKVKKSKDGEGEIEEDFFDEEEDAA